MVLVLRNVPILCNGMCEKSHRMFGRYEELNFCGKVEARRLMKRSYLYEQIRKPAKVCKE